jgi:hypothetical protein
LFGAGDSGVNGSYSIIVVIQQLIVMKGDFVLEALFYRACSVLGWGCFTMGQE